VYWNWLNANGGVIGRKVNMTIEDDAYTPQGAQQAAQQCEALNPFFVLGGIGFDQDPVVRQIAEQDHFIYIYTMADQGTGHYNYSFTGSPTIQQDGTWNAEALLDNHYPGPYGAVYVNDAAWLGGWTTFKSYMDAHGGKSVDGNAYTTNSGGDTSGFQAYITQLKLAGVKTVYLWMNALAVDAFVEQAANQCYFPAYVTPDGFNLVTQTVGQSIDDKSQAVKPAMGVWITPAFDPNNHNVAWWPQEKAMLDAYAQYDSGHTPDDIDWMAWLSFQQVTDLLNTCGHDCNKNDVAGMFKSGWQDTRYPMCPVDFRNNADFGGVSANLFVATREGNQTVWRQPVSCASRF
jgi:ABC-type branched-subunit amino acid transport system substrate-binding protein